MLVSAMEKKPETISSTISTMTIVPGERGSKRFCGVEGPLQYRRLVAERQVARCSSTSSTKRVPK